MTTLSTAVYEATQTIATVHTLAWQ